MLCNVEIGKTSSSGRGSSLCNYYVIAPTLEAAIVIAQERAREEYSEEEEEWYQAIEASVSCGDDPLRIVSA